jgi:hypothetical protein
VHFFPVLWIRDKNLTKKIVSQLLFIPDPDFLPIPEPGIKKAPDPGSATATLLFYGFLISVLMVLGYVQDINLNSTVEIAIFNCPLLSRLCEYR